MPLTAILTYSVCLYAMIGEVAKDPTAVMAIKPSPFTALIASLCALITSASLHAATPLEPKSRSAGTPTWVKRFQPGYLDTGWSATQTRDGHFVIAMQSLNHTAKSNALVFVKLTPTGRVLWQRRLSNHVPHGNQVCELPMRLRESRDGSLLVAATRCLQTSSAIRIDHHAWFARLDPTGALRWEVSRDRPPTALKENKPYVSAYGWDLVERPDGRLLGLATGFGPDALHLWMLEIDANGSVHRVRLGADYINQDEYWWGVSSAGHENEELRIGFSSAGTHAIHIARLDPELNYRDEVSVPATRGFNELRGISPAPDGGFCTLTSESDALFIARYERDASLRWRHPLEQEQGTRILATRDGGCLLAAGLESGIAALRLIKWGYDGKTLWRQTISGRWIPKDLLETQAGGLFVTGTEVPANFMGSVAFALHVAPADLGKANLTPTRR